MLIPLHRNIAHCQSTSVMTNWLCRQCLFRMIPCQNNFSIWYVLITEQVTQSYVLNKNDTSFCDAECIYWNWLMSPCWPLKEPISTCSWPYTRRPFSSCSHLSPYREDSLWTCQCRDRLEETEKEKHDRCKKHFTWCNVAKSSIFPPVSPRFYCITLEIIQIPSVVDSNIPVPQVVSIAHFPNKGFVKK